MVQGKCKTEKLEKERRRKISETMKAKGYKPPNLKGHKWTKEQNLKRSKKLKGHKYHGDYFKGARKKIKQYGIQKISKAERILERYFTRNNFNFIPQWEYKLGIADFYLPDYNLIIECDGIYWHSKPDYIKRDKKKREWLKNNGYNVLVVTSENIVKGEKNFEFN